MKLKVNKTTLAELNRDQLDLVSGGGSNSYITCAGTCGCPTTVDTSVACPTTTGSCVTTSTK